jgi:hypothetical protein
MKKHIFAIVLTILAFASFNLAQSVVITSKKTTYRRPKPMSAYKKTFTVTRPRVKASTPALSKKIEAAISYEKVSDLNIKEELSEVQWLESADYTVNYNKNGILDLTLSVEGSGAYPSTYNRPVIVNTKTGGTVTPREVFTNLAGLAAKCKKAQEAEIKQAIIDIKKDNPDEENPASLFESSDFKIENLNKFTVSDKGITFLYDYDFPHVILALQPNGEYFFSWKALKPFVKPAGLFGRFVH